MLSDTSGRVCSSDGSVVPQRQLVALPGHLRKKHAAMELIQTPALLLLRTRSFIIKLFFPSVADVQYTEIHSSVLQPSIFKLSGKPIDKQRKSRTPADRLDPMPYTHNASRKSKKKTERQGAKLNSSTQQTSQAHLRHIQLLRYSLKRDVFTQRDRP